MQDDDQQLIHDVETIGWHILLIPEDEEGPGFAFTVGLYHSFRHPEVLIMGLPLQVMMDLLNIVGDQVKAGNRYHPDQRTTDLLEGYECAFRTIPTTAYEEYLGYAMWFYKGTDFPALQCFWPDKGGRFSWEPGFDTRLVNMQATLYEMGSDR